MRFDRPSLFLLLAAGIVRLIVNDPSVPGLVGYAFLARLSWSLKQSELASRLNRHGQVSTLNAACASAVGDRGRPKLLSP